jgi:hypothetical protein
MDPAWGTFLGKLLPAGFGALFIFLGIKGISKNGLPITRSIRLQGLWGDLVGLALLGAGVWWIHATFIADHTPPAPPPATLTSRPAARSGTRSAARAPSATTPALAGPRPFRLPAGNCQVTAPVQLRDVSPAGSLNGARLHTFTGVDPLTRNIFKLCYLDPPPGTVPNIASEAAAVITAAGLTPENSSDKLFADRYQACEVQGSGIIADVPMRAITRCILIRNRLYYLVVLGPTANLDDDVAYTFLDSFDLLADIGGR